MITRSAEKLLRLLAKEFRSVAVVGPRQSGKTTLVKSVFPRKPYVSLEDPDERNQANNDPRAFLARFKNGAIIDEAQRVPALFSYLQRVLDTTKKDGLFILTGSNNFLLQESISQTLAGRIGYMDLLPLCYQELTQFNLAKASTNQLIWNGCYPEIYDRERSPSLWYPAYIRTYVERDVRQIKNVTDTLLFTRFLQLCAGRVAQQLNTTSLSNECGIDARTVQNWLGILESSYVIFMLQPHHKNFNKRIVKTPKLYFYDSGLACSLLGIKSEKELTNSHYRGALFENYVVTECLKNKHNTGSRTSFYYWRDNKGVEVDLLADTGKKLLPIEIKSTQTFREDSLTNIFKWNTYAEQKGGLLLFDGEQNFTRSDKISILNWRKVRSIRRLF
ncbi:MAG TPA: ATP-binding protein [Cyclobacteriaceae bacterium]|nr:ATP-binding protein [Cyclobacteriaceae bacterium]